MINHLVYIGKAVNVERRRNVHKWAYTSSKSREYNNQIHTAMRKYGYENFSFEIVELCPKEKLDEREKYWIAYYNSYKNGYNGTEGGSIEEADVSGEHNGRAYMTEKEVEYIRKCYNNHINFRDVYAQFKDKATKRCIQKIWYFETWPNIHPEYNTPENKLYHSTKAKANSSEIAANNKRHFSPDEIRFLRSEYAKGATAKELQKKYYPELAYSTVRNAIIRVTYKDIE